MSKEPKRVKEVHELMRRIQEKKEKVSDEEIVYNLKKAIEDKENHGLWIKKEENSSKGTSSVSFLQVAYEKSLLGYRILNKPNQNKE